jgi:hypothetical protein
MNVNSTAARAFARMNADEAQTFKDMPSLWKELSDLKNRQRDQRGTLEAFRPSVEVAQDKTWSLKAMEPGTDANALAFRERAFDQFCQTIDFPSRTLTACPGELASQSVAYFSFASGGKGSFVRMEDNQIRAWLSDKYEAVNHGEIVSRLMESGVRWNVNFAGLTPKRMFILGVDPDTKWDGPDGSKLSHCTLVGNSETGEGTFFAQDLWFDHICANRNIWGWQLRGGRFDRIHKGNVRDGLKEMFQWITAGRTKAEEEAKTAFIAAAKDFVPETDEKIIEWVRNFGIGAWDAKGAVKSAHDRWPGKRLSRFNIVSGLTAIAQKKDMDARYDLEMAAGALVMAKK